MVPDGGGDAGTEFEAIMEVEFEDLPSVPDRGVGEGVRVGVAGGLKFCWTFGS